MWNIMESSCPKHFRFIDVKSIFSALSCIELTYMLVKGGFVLLERMDEDVG